MWKQAARYSRQRASRSVDVRRRRRSPLDAFAIGYHIVRDYLHHRPHASWAALTSTSARAILAGSHYHPCTQP